jgi:RNA polymerase sigma-70 factor (ECF subfamily)
MADSDSLALEFEEHRAHLRGVAYRVLGSASDADDAVQETWLRLSRTDVSGVLNPRAWLTTVVGRVALNMLESRGTRRENMSAEPPEPTQDGPHTSGPPPADPEDEALLGDEVGAALQVVLDTLEPRERLAFVLHDLFAVPFDEIAPVVDTSSAAARQLASRARRRLRRWRPGRTSSGRSWTRSSRRHARLSS